MIMLECREYEKQWNLPFDLIQGYKGAVWLRVQGVTPNPLRQVIPTGFRL